MTQHVQQASNDSNLPHPIQVQFARDVTICLVGGRGARRHDEEKFDGEDQRAWSKWWVTFASRCGKDSPQFTCKLLPSVPCRVQSS